VAIVRRGQQRDRQRRRRNASHPHARGCPSAGRRPSTCRSHYGRRDSSTGHLHDQLPGERSARR
jgi:hypothetical protein